MCNFNFISVEDAPGISVSTDWMTFGEPFDKVEKLGFDSLSTFVNNISLFLSFIGLFALHMTLKLFLCWRNKKHQSKCIKFFSIIRSKVTDLIFYIMYWRLLIEAHENLVLSSTLEIKELQSASTPEILSLVIAWVVLGICFLMPVVAFYLFYVHRKEYDPEKKHMLMEFFEGLKNKKIARLYTGASFLRRVLFVWTIIFLPGNLDRTYVYIILLSIQVIYIACIVR